MADNIVGGLFGVDPAQLQQQRMTQDLREGFMLAQLSPLDRATAGIYAGSKQLGRAGQSLLGMEDPQLQEAAMAKKLSENFDVNSVEGLRGLAIELQKAGSLRYSQLAAQQANQLEASAAERGLKAAQTVKAMREPSRTALSTLIASGKYTPASLALYEKSENPADLVLVDKKEGKELPAGTMKEIATADRNNFILTKTNTTLDDYITKVENDEIKFTLGANIAGWVQKQTGKQDANTREQVSLKKFLETERNNILLAAKGTQTEGDAQRAMSQIFDTTDWRNSESVKQALTDLKTYKEAQIDANNVFIGTLRNEPPKQAAPKQPPQADGEFAADYAKYKEKYKDQALPYNAYVAKRKGL